MWRIARPAIAQQHRLNAGVIVEQPLLTVRFRNGRKLGTIEEGFASTLAPGDHFFFAGLSLEVEQFKDTDIVVHASSKRARIVTYGGQRMSMSTHLANRVRHMLCDRNDWSRFPDDVREWLEVQSERSVLPEPHQLLVETFPHEGQHFMVAYSFEGWNAHQSLGMLITRRMESAGLKPLGFVANDYALACYGLEPITDPQALFSADILEQEFVDWVESSYLLKTAFREVAVIGGLVERQHPGKKKTGTAGQLLDRPHLRRAAPLRASALAPPRRLGRCPTAHDGARTARAPRRPRLGDHAPRRDRPDHADGGAADGDRRPRSAAAGRRGRRGAPDASRSARRSRHALVIRSLPVRAASANFGHEARHRPPCPCPARGCVVGTLAKTAVDVVTLPVKVASAESTRSPPARRKPTRSAAAKRASRTSSAASRSAWRRSAAARAAAPDRQLRCGRSALRYFLDTEYNGWGGALLSLALVPDDGEELYLTLDWDGALEEWVERNVIPYLDTVPEALVSPRMSRADAARSDRPLSRRRSRSADPRRLARRHRFDERAAGYGSWRDGRGPRAEVPFVPLIGFSTAANSKVPHNALHDARALRDHILSLE